MPDAGEPFPEQRAVLLLHDVFDYDYAQIAEIAKSQDNTRQLATGPDTTSSNAGPASKPPASSADELAARFFDAAEQCDLAELEALLTSDVELTGDGGGKVPALARTLRGRNRVASTLIEWASVRVRVPGLSPPPVEVNGGSGAMFHDQRQRLIGVWALDIADDQIKSIGSIVTPTSSRTSGQSATSDRY